MAKAIMEKIASILQKLDIEGLIEAGAPADEYNSEAEAIATELVELKKSEFKKQAIVELISLIWAKNFNLSNDELKLRMPLIVQAAEMLSENSA